MIGRENPRYTGRENFGEVRYKIKEEENKLQLLRLVEKRNLE